MKHNRFKHLLTALVLTTALFVLVGCTAVTPAATTTVAATATTAETATATATATATQAPTATAVPTATAAPTATVAAAADKAALKVFDATELAKYDGKNGNLAYVAVDGTVYDVTNVAAWRDGAHAGGSLTAGADQTEALKRSPHGAKNLEGLPVVGTYQ